MIRYYVSFNAATTEDKSEDSSWIEVSEIQYTQAVEALLSGLEVIVDEGFKIRIKQPSPDYVWQDGEWVYVAPEQPAPEEPPLIVSARQIRLALNQLGLRNAVEDYVLISSQDVKDSWEYSTQFEINHPMIEGAIQALNKTESDKISLFQLASTL